MIFPPTLAEIEDALMRMLCLGRLRHVSKLRADECDAELEQERREYLRDAQRRSRARRR